MYSKLGLKRRSPPERLLKQRIHTLLRFRRQPFSKAIPFGPGAAAMPQNFRTSRVPSSLRMLSAISAEQDPWHVPMTFLGAAMHSRTCRRMTWFGW